MPEGFYTYIWLREDEIAKLGGNARWAKERGLHAE